MLGRADDAFADVNRAVELSPRSPDALSARALLHAAAGREDRALADMEPDLRKFIPEARRRAGK